MDSVKAGQVARDQCQEKCQVAGDKQREKFIFSTCSLSLVTFVVACHLLLVTRFK
jgi:hypothetical protein